MKQNALRRVPVPKTFRRRRSILPKCLLLATCFVVLPATTTAEAALVPDSRPGTGNRQGHPRAPSVQDSLQDTPDQPPPFPESVEEAWENQLETRMERLDEAGIIPGEDWEETLSERSYYQDNPLNLNSVTADDLRKLRILDEWQIQALLHYRESYGQIVHWKEISDFVPGFNDHTTRLLQPYLYLGPETERLSLSGLLKQGKHQVLSRYARSLNAGKAFREGKYAGPPDAWYFRYLFNARNHIRIGFAAQQDPGEAFGPYGFDFYSGYLALNQIGPLRQFVAGTYRIDWGWGLHLHSGGSFYGGVQPGLMASVGTGIRPFASGAEYGFLQGAAAEFQLPRNWEAGILYSNRKRDGRFEFPSSLSSPDAQESGSGESGSPVPATGQIPGLLEMVSSLPQTGYHRTTTEQAGKHKLREEIWGLHVGKSWKQARMGINFSAGKLGGTYNPGMKTGQQARSLLPLGQVYMEMAVSAHYQVLLKSLHLYGEAALRPWTQGLEPPCQRPGVPESPSGSLPATNRTEQPGSNGKHQSKNFAYAVLQGLQWKPSESFSLAARYTYYSPTWYLLYGSMPLSFPAASAKQGRQRQEFEWQALALLPHSFSIETQAYLQAGRNTQGLVSLNYSLSGKLAYAKRDFELYLQCRYGESQTRQGLSLRLNFAYQLPAGFFGESRMESWNFKQGILLMQDFGFALPGNRFKIRFRAALFHTQDYASRIYAYEHDVLYASSVTALYGRGIRLALNLRYQACRWFVLECKYAHTLQDGVRKTGSGDNERTGFLVPEIKIQARFKF